MSFGDVIQLGQQAIWVCLLAAAPVLLLSMVVGLAVSIFQAVTQIQEQTLAFIPKIAVTALALLFFAPFILAVITNFAAHIFVNIPNYVK